MLPTIQAKVNLRDTPALDTRLVLDRVRGAVRKSAMRLLAHVKSKKLSGQVLNVRTGRLRRSITAKFSESGAKFTSVVGTAVKYARIHEYGFKGEVNVREHSRLQTKAWGRDITPTHVVVSPHARNVNMPERSFMRSSLSELRPTIVKDIRAALAGVRK